eukprot:31606-Rhodomonas_salina.1
MRRMTGGARERGSGRDLCGVALLVGRLHIHAPRHQRRHHLCPPDLEPPPLLQPSSNLPPCPTTATARAQRNRHGGERKQSVGSGERAGGDQGSRRGQRGGGLCCALA